MLIKSDKKVGQPDLPVPDVKPLQARSEGAACVNYVELKPSVERFFTTIESDFHFRRDRRGQASITFDDFQLFLRRWLTDMAAQRGGRARGAGEMRPGHRRRETKV